MSRRSPFVVVLSDADRKGLEDRARAYTLSHAQVVRAKIVLMAAEGLSNSAIAERLDVHVDVVSRWRKRFCQEGIDGLGDRRRSGAGPV
jgi:DNA-directed RNA polymerase specialized sigma24 family protein